MEKMLKKEEKMKKKQELKQKAKEHQQNGSWLNFLGTTLEFFFYALCSPEVLCGLMLLGVASVLLSHIGAIVVGAGLLLLFGFVLFWF